MTDHIPLTEGKLKGNIKRLYGSNGDPPPGPRPDPPRPPPQPPKYLHDLTPENEAAILAVLEWAVPMAKHGLETNRQERLRCGHHDIRGTYASGETWVGVWQQEVDESDRADNILKLLRYRKGLDRS